MKNKFLASILLSLGIATQAHSIALVDANSLDRLGTDILGNLVQLPLGLLGSSVPIPGGTELTGQLVGLVDDDGPLAGVGDLGESLLGGSGGLSVGTDLIYTLLAEDGLAEPFLLIGAKSVVDLTAPVKSLFHSGLIPLKTADIALLGELLPLDSLTEGLPGLPGLGEAGSMDILGSLTSVGGGGGQLPLSSLLTSLGDGLDLLSLDALPLASILNGSPFDGLLLPR